MTESLAQASPASHVEPVRSKRLVLADHEVPTGALQWSTNKDKSHALREWRRGISATFAEKARSIRVAWALEWLFQRSGYAYPTDSFLMRETGLPVAKVQAALHDLEKGGAIIRTHIIRSGSVTQRRIWPARKIAQPIPPTVGNTYTPHIGSNHTPTVGGHNTYRNRFRPSSTLVASRLDAERRAARERGGQ